MFAFWVFERALMVALFALLVPAIIANAWESLQYEEDE